ncbi:unnamed protein product [Prunus armeniaca]|uniref:Uncharacterized protein n=1 Tax=Prunus armeniaca TaxID=36596 RepID=A0A6J5V9U9_PRUAR|nr:unnamed protein product [Prunus armeniaca]
MNQSNTFPNIPDLVHENFLNRTIRKNSGALKDISKSAQFSFHQYRDDKAPLVSIRIQSVGIACLVIRGSPLLFGTWIEVELLGICGVSPRFSLSPIKGRSFNFTLRCVECEYIGNPPSILGLEGF